MPESLSTLEQAIADRWQPAGMWAPDGARHVIRAIDVQSGAAVRVTTVFCAREGMATASLAREIGALELLAHHPSVTPLIDSGRAHGWLYMVTPWLDGCSVAAIHGQGTTIAVADAIGYALAVADLLHFSHSLGVVHCAISANAVCLADGQVVVRDFHRCARMAPDAHDSRAAAADTTALSAVLFEMVCGGPWTAGSELPDTLPDALSQILHRALGANRDARFMSAIALAQALYGILDAGMVTNGEVCGRDADGDADEDVLPLADGAERSLRVLHALLDRAEISEIAPDDADPLVQQCWRRAERDVAPDDARLVALQCRWRLLADRDPVAAAHVSFPARNAAAVRPYRARALASMGRAAEARTLAVRAWFDDVALDLSALRSVTRALLLTRDFDLAALVGVAECALGSADPVLAEAARVSGSHAAPPPDAGARSRALDAISSAMDARIPWTAELLVDPRWDGLRADHRFNALVARSCSIWSAPLRSAPPMSVRAPVACAPSAHRAG